MELKLAAVSLEKVLRQRNLFLCVAGMMLISNFLLSVKLYRSEEIVTAIPGLTRTISISESGVSEGYLEEWSLLYLSALLDLSPETVEHKRDMILKHSSASNKKHLQNIKEYFANSIEEHRKFGIITYFTPKNLTIDTKNLKVIARGVLTSNFGKRAAPREEVVSYLISFDQVGRIIKLREFYKIQEEKKEKSSPF